MSPLQAKKKQHRSYNSLAVKVASGKAGYSPAKKSKLSKSASDKFSLSVSFS